jgi:hypothetical protein
MSDEEYARMLQSQEDEGAPGLAEGVRATYYAILIFYLLITEMVQKILAASHGGCPVLARY